MGSNYDIRLLGHLIPLLVDEEPAIRDMSAAILRTILFLPLLPSWDLPTYEDCPPDVQYSQLRETAEVFVALLTSFWSENRNQPLIRNRFLKSLTHFREIRHLLNPIFQETGEETALRSFSDFCDLEEQFDYPGQLILALTYHCQLHCAYCFSRHRKEETMTERIFSRILTWMKHADCRRICFTGGEPTQHPRFTEFLLQCRDAGLQIYFNSNGLFDRQVADSLSPDYIVSLGIHLAYPEQYNECRRQVLFDNLRRLKKKSIPIFFRINIDSSCHSRWEEAFHLCDRYDVNHLHLALCFPVEDGLNRHVAQSDINQHTTQIADILQECSYRNISLAFAKPIPLCFFPLEIWRELQKRHDPFHSCGVYKNKYTHNVVVHPDGKVTACLALERWQKSLFDFENRQVMGDYFRPHLQNLLQKPISPDCFHCLFFLEKNARDSAWPITCGQSRTMTGRTKPPSFSIRGFGPSRDVPLIGGGVGATPDYYPESRWDSQKRSNRPDLIGIPKK